VLGWKLPALLASADADGDFYSGRINQIMVPCWSHGRIALVGNAACCGSPMTGFGGSIAIIGAERMADALEQHPRVHVPAFRHYEEGLRPFVAGVQNHAAT
jgi:2-polyprenyl-6-methoxyphenol hydroxylase-like FAD-dependent oxidoreductase